MNVCCPDQHPVENGLRALAFDFATSARNASFDSNKSLIRESSSPGSSGWMAMNRSPGSSTTKASPESAHSVSVPRGSASRRLSGIVLMATELLPFDKQLVAILPSDDKQNNLVLFHIIQYPQVPYAQFKLRQGIR